MRNNNNSESGNLSDFSRHLIGYLIVGSGNAILTIGLFTIMIKVIGIDYKIAFTIAWLTGVIATYIVNHIWVFKPEQKLQFRHRFGKYLTVYISSYLISLYLIFLLVERLFIDPVLAEFLVIPVIIIINFTGIKYWAMNKSGNPEKIIIYIILAILTFHFFSGIFPFSRFEGDSMGICNGCYEIIRSGDWGSNFFSYSYDMQAGTYWLIILFMKITSLPASMIYTVSSAILGLLCMLLIADLLSMILKRDIKIVFIILFLFQEIFSISFYANSAVFAAFFWLLAFDILLTYDKLWSYLTSVILLSIAFWCRVDVAFAMTGILPLLYIKYSWKKTLILSFIIGMSTIISGLFLFKLSGVNIAGFTHYSADFAGVITKGKSDLGFLNIFSIKSHFGFFSILLIVLFISGMIKLVINKEVKLLLFIFPIIIYYLFNSTHVFAAKHLYYNLIYFAIPMIYFLYVTSWKKFTVLSLIMLFISQYLIGWQVHFSSIPWQDKEYSQLHPYPVILKLLRFDIPVKKENSLDLVVGCGTKIPTSDEILLSSGIVYSPIMWNHLKRKYKGSFQFLKDVVEKKQETIYLSTSQSSSQFVFNVLLENNWIYIPDSSIKFGFDKWHNFKKGNRLTRVYISRYKRDVKNFIGNFNKIGQSEFYHISCWDWENYYLREYMKDIAEPMSDFIYEINLD